MINTLKILLVFGLVLLAEKSVADTLNGKVVSVMDGDTVTIKTTEGTYYKVRLAEVDAPEPSQTYGKQARQFTQNLALAKTVKVNYQTVDHFSRLIGEVILPDGRILNHELVRHGYAWHYRVHYPANQSLRDLEYQAWKKKAGLWVDLSALPPWEFRREPFLADPPENPSQMDYDRIFNYGLIGDPGTKRYQWPGCRNYPKRKKGFAVFGNKLQAADSGFKISPDCTGG